MIDLRCRDLPQAIEVNGKSFLINTDFRYWIKFGELVKQDETLDKFLYLFKNKVPQDPEFFNALMDFYNNPNATPKSPPSNGNDIIDYVLDGEYIFGSFMQAYHIDLVDIEYMHWHKFKALLLCLPSSSKMMEIMSLRGWEKDNTSYERQCQKNRDAWALPRRITEKEDETMKEINDLFYNC